MKQADKKTDHPIILQKPEIKNPSEREQKEVNKEQKEIEKGPRRENIEKQEIPQIPPAAPEIEQPAPAVVPEIQPDPTPNTNPS